jgi:hypothetical protein
VWLLVFWSEGGTLRGQRGTQSRADEDDLVSQMPALAELSASAVEDRSRHHRRLGYSPPSGHARSQATRAYLWSYRQLRLRLGAAAEEAAFHAGDHNPSHARTVVDDWMSDHEEYCDRICSGAVERALRLADERHPPDDDYGEPFGRPIRYTPLCLDRHLERPCEPLIIRGAPDLDSPAVGTLPQREDISVEGWPLGWWLELPANYALIDDGSEARREVIDRRFVQLCESGPNYVGAPMATTATKSLPSSHHKASLRRPPVTSSTLRIGWPYSVPKNEPRAASRRPMRQTAVPTN